jgi:hypothetical protein
MADATIKIRGGAGNATQIQSRDIDAAAPTDGQALAWSNSDSEWEPTTISAGSSEWTDTGTVLHPTESTLDNVVVGGTTTGNSDIVLGVDGSAVFNEQGAAVDFRIESDTKQNMFIVDGSENKIGMGDIAVPLDLLNLKGYTPNVRLSNDDETESGVIFDDSAQPLSQKASIIFDSGNTSGLTNALSLMTSGGVVAITGSINPTASTSVVGVGTAFTTQLRVGDRITVSGETRTIATITDDTNLTVTAAFTDTANDTAVEMERRAMQISSAGLVGIGVKPSTAGETLAINGAAAFLEQHSTFVPSTVSTYSKLYSKREDGPRFGTASADLLKSSTEYLRVAYDAANPDFELGTGELTAEGWFMWRGVSATSFELMSIGRWNESGLECVWLGTNDSFKMYIDGTTVINTGASSFTPTLKQWYHIAFTRDGSDDCRIFVDGAQVGSTVNDTGTITGNNATGLNGFKVGNDSAGTSSWDGWIDEVRISDTARYTSTFTPPTAAFTTDANTVALYHMDGSAGGTTFTDSSGNGQDLTAVNGATTEIGQAELYAFDGSGNSTKISPHNAEGEWEYYSKNVNTGKTVRINMEEAIRDLGELTGKDYIKRG